MPLASFIRGLLFRGHVDDLDAAIFRRQRV
jgi:hypothetical protein